MYLYMCIYLYIYIYTILDIAYGLPLMHMSSHTILDNGPGPGPETPKPASRQDLHPAAFGSSSKNIPNI